MIIVTGAAGFIGSNLVAALNTRGEDDILAVDNLSNADKYRNLLDCHISNYIHKGAFLEALRNGAYDKLAKKGKITAVFHQGACSDTMCHDGEYMMSNNFAYSQTLLNWCTQYGIPFIYASSAAVYGGSTVFVEQRPHEAPLNIYGYSKFLFDQVVRQRFAQDVVASTEGDKSLGMFDKPLPSQVVGLRYFNVYGPREQHKGRMASVAYHHNQQFKKDGKIVLFDGWDGWQAGQQQRDFIYVRDVVKVNLHFLDNPKVSGIFNCGTGRAQTFNDIAVSVLNTVRDGQSTLSLPEMVQAGLLGYIPFPDALKGKYQSFTQANIDALRRSGYTQAFATVEEGVAEYTRHLLKQ